MLRQLLAVVIPVFAIAGAGWVFAGYRKIDISSMTTVIIYLAGPALVFHSLASAPLTMDGLLAMGGGAILQVLVCGGTAWLVYRSVGLTGRGLYLPPMFPNTGNLGLPLALFAFGPTGLAAAIIVFTTVSLLQFTLGILVVSGSPRPTEILRMPLVYAAVLGVLASFVGFEPPDPMMKALELVGAATVPMMLLSLGMHLRTVRLTRPAIAVLSVALRYVPGLAAALVWVHLLGLEGPERGVILVTGVLPPAVMNFVFAEAYGRQPDEVASSILLGTLLSMLAIPAVLAVLA